VTRAERSSLKEASRTSQELIELGMKNQQLLVNGVFKSLDKNDPFAAKVEALAIKELNNIPESIKELPIQVFPLLPYNILGLEKLRSLVDPELQRNAIAESVKGHKWAHQAIAGLDQLVDELTANKKSGLIMTLGKGGVGKTLTASALAIMIARRGFDVHLTTTDPAAHLQGFMNQLKDIPEGLSIDRIDPKAETQRYIDKVLPKRARTLTRMDGDYCRTLIALAEEVAVFHAFSKVIMSRRKFVVIDTAQQGIPYCWIRQEAAIQSARNTTPRLPK
jgi:arsenite-transporting ATPase